MRLKKIFKIYSVYISRVKRLNLRIYILCLQPSEKSNIRKTLTHLSNFNKNTTNWMYEYKNWNNIQFLQYVNTSLLQNHSQWNSCMNRLQQQIHQFFFPIFQKYQSFNPLLFKLCWKYLCNLDYQLQRNRTWWMLIMLPFAFHQHVNS